MVEEINTNENVESEETSKESVDMSAVSTIKKGDTVTGTVVKIHDKQVYVDVGYKYDGILQANELSSLPIEDISSFVQVGQEMTCKVLSINDTKETLLLSKRLIDSNKAWDRMQQLLDNNEGFEAQIVDAVKGGLVVDVGVRGFIPASMIERQFIDDLSIYKGRTLGLKVKEIDKLKNKLILSHKDVVEEQMKVKKQEVLEKIQTDQILEGTVQRLTPFGVFVDLGGVDGLIHISELSWNHVDQPSEVIKEGDKVNVKVLKIDRANERISLSLKAATPGPWENIGHELKSGDTVEGKVKRLVDFGAFVEVASGIEGLVHISHISHRRIGTPHEVLKVGQIVNVKILEINPAEKRISLSIKETEVAPEPLRQERQFKAQKQQIELPENQSLNLTLGERLGEKLSKFK